MAGLFSKLFRGSTPSRTPTLPDGLRVYAIGDIHGRLDLLVPLSEAIERDNESRKPMHSIVVLLGDLVDRGPHSAGVIDYAREWNTLREMRFISGNHEEMFLRAFSEKSAFKGFLKFGGIETLASYGLDAEALDELEFDEVAYKLRRAVPKEHRDFMRSFELSVHFGDYMFVHAGIHPKISLDQQHEHDCRWIREPFLSHRGDLGCVVVHGHTVTDEAVVRDNRIGIDTGAYESNVLTALCLEGTERRLIQTALASGKVITRETPVRLDEDLEQAMPGSL